MWANRFFPILFHFLWITCSGWILWWNLHVMSCAQTQKLVKLLFLTLRSLVAVRRLSSLAFKAFGCGLTYQGLVKEAKLHFLACCSLHSPCRPLYVFQDLLQDILRSWKQSFSAHIINPAASDFTTVSSLVEQRYPEMTLVVYLSLSFIPVSLLHTLLSLMVAVSLLTL